jgi:hypothetical protein
MNETVNCPECDKAMRKSGDVFTESSTPGVTFYKFLCKTRGCPVLSVEVGRVDKDEPSVKKEVKAAS